MVSRSSLRAAKIRAKNPAVVVVPYQPQVIAPECGAKHVPRAQFAQYKALNSDAETVKAAQAKALEHDLELALRAASREQAKEIAKEAARLIRRRK